MKFLYRVSAFVVEEGSDRRVDAPRDLGEWSYGEDRLEPYLDAEVADQGVVGGLIRAALTEEGVPQILVEYWSAVTLDETTLKALGEFTAVQMEDGVGEGGFEVLSEGQRYRLVPDLGSAVEVEQIDDGREIRPPSLIAMSARDGNESALQGALSLGAESVDSTHQGYTGLHLAILYGHFDVAMLLIAHGADVNRSDISGNSPLYLCAAARLLSDEASARLSRALLSHGADPTQCGPTGQTPKSLAEIREKSLMVKVISTAT